MIGTFKLGNTTQDFIDVTCKTDPTSNQPYFDPPYDHLNNPFPECELVETTCKYCNNIQVREFIWSLVIEV